MHNHYAFIYNELVWKVLKETVGEQEAVLFARSASVGAQRSRCTGAATATPTTNRWRKACAAGCRIGMSGFGFLESRYRRFRKHRAGPRLSAGAPSACLSSHSRLHGSKSYRAMGLTMT